MACQKNDPLRGESQRAGINEGFHRHFNTPEYSPTELESQNHALHVLIIARRHRLSIPIARTVCRLAGIGGSNASL